MVEGLVPAAASSRRRSIASFSESSTSSTRRVRAVVARLPCWPHASSAFFAVAALPLVPAPEREVEGGPLSHLALGPHPAAVTVHDPRHRREPYARPLELVLPVQPLEGPEQLVRVRLVEAGPVVPHVVGGLGNPGRGAPVRAELYGGLLFSRVNFHALPSRFSSATLSRLGSPQASMPSPATNSTFRSGCDPSKLLDYLLARRGQVDQLPAQGPAAHPGEIEQVVYERGHVPAGGPYPAR